ncbi:hypothetical protein DFJ58DRAFT_910451 [Suillus subalutaceus]|uniref:uncharacterized protein n=1 Tax=Suillus subalutaceus TaxID=48586 RepID=UPI001B874122|nr:uncharacterized protein DFJ58DRAFT_910451 [Suillus subalutaceus]KAG1873707.1 hypothetical protein DFJ58DRAFT_910451 [Suillus subalutaceus]
MWMLAPRKVVHWVLRRGMVPVQRSLRDWWMEKQSSGFTGVGPKENEGTAVAAGVVDTAGLAKRLGVEGADDMRNYTLAEAYHSRVQVQLRPGPYSDINPRQISPPEHSESREATAGESSSQPRSGFRQALRKFKKNFTKKVYKRFKRSRHQTPTVQNADHEDASSNQNIEDASRLHPSDADKLATPENLSGCVNQEASGEPTSKVHAASSGVEIPDPQSVDAGLRDAREGMEKFLILSSGILRMYGLLSYV